MTSLSKDHLRVEIKKEPEGADRSPEKANIETTETTERATPRPRPKLPAYVHPH